VRVVLEVVGGEVQGPRRHGHRPEHEQHPSDEGTGLEAAVGEQAVVADRHAETDEDV
jgi:hypothetical protein